MHKPPAMTLQDHLRVIFTILLTLSAFIGGLVFVRITLFGAGSFRREQPTPARDVEANRDSKQTREVLQLCSQYIEQRFRATVCGLAALHFGINLRVACIRRSDGSIVELINPFVYSLTAPETSEPRSVGTGDPMCTRGLQQILTGHYSEEVKVVKQPGQYAEVWRGSDARCIQKLTQLMNLTRADQWPCVADRWDPLDMDVVF